jgi:DegV family protein with EDD domain
MLNVHIITDSGAHFTDLRFVQQNPVTVVPNKLDIGGKSYYEGVDLDAESALRFIAAQPKPPVLTPPSVTDYVQAYNKAARTADVILSIHASREIYGSWSNARKAAQQVSAHNRIAVIDSQSLCVGQGMLVQAAADAAKTEQTMDDLVRKVRGVVERIYSVYYVESIDYLLHNKLISVSHGILGAMLGIRPFLTIENGRLTPIEKVRTRMQAIERLVEFIIEFTDLKDVMILQNKPEQTDQTRMIQDRLAAEFQGRDFPYSVYNASLAALIGTDATGLVILEEDVDEGHDDFKED